MNLDFPLAEVLESEAVCLRERGFDVPSTVQEDPEPMGGDPSIRNILEPATGQQPARYGEFERNMSQQEFEQFDEASNECNRRALDLAYGQSGGSETGYPVMVEQAFDEMYARVNADERVVAAEAEFAACMENRGVTGISSVEDIAKRNNQLADQLIKLVNENPDLTESNPEVAALVKADDVLLSSATACREEVDYDRIGYEVALEVQQAWLDENPGFAEEVAALKTTVPAP